MSQFRTFIDHFFIDSIFKFLSFRANPLSISILYWSQFGAFIQFSKKFTFYEIFIFSIKMSQNGFLKKGYVDLLWSSDHSGRFCAIFGRAPHTHWPLLTEFFFDAQEANELMNNGSNIYKFELKLTHFGSLNLLLKENFILLGLLDFLKCFLLNFGNF